MTEKHSPTHINNILKISTIFGIVILSFDFFLLIINKVNIADPNNFWINIKYLIWAIGIFYALKWLHIQNPSRAFISYLGFALAIASFVSLYDIFFYLFYFKLINPDLKEVIIQSMLTYNQDLFANNPEFTQDLLQQTLEANFGIVYSISLFVSYIFLFLFYSFFFTLFLKFTEKKQKF